MRFLKITEAWNNKVFEKVPTHNAKQINKILEDGKCHAKKKSSNFPLSERIQILKKFIELIKKNKDFLAKQASKEGGKPLLDSIIEINRGTDGVESCIEILKTHSGDVIPMNIDKASSNRIAFTQKEPIGLVLAISAFNHPFNLIIHQIIPAIAVGCPVIVKPAEDTPLSCLSIIKMLNESGIPKKWCQFIMPESLELATKLVEDTRIDFFSFIGSSKVGWYLKTKLAPGVRCSLEHGGMAPVFIENDAEIDPTISSITRGGYYHAGQVCVSVQRIFVHKKIHRLFTEKLKVSVENIIVGNPLKKKTFVGPLIRPKEVDRVERWINESSRNGADIITGGKRLSKTCYKPTIISNPENSDKISQMEIFGPVVCIYKYENIKHAIKLANNVNASFQASIFSNKINTILNFYNSINASAVFHNDHTAFRVDWMPFAGLKNSGYGVGGIKYTMNEMQINKMLILRKD